MKSWILPSSSMIYFIFTFLGYLTYKFGLSTQISKFSQPPLMIEILKNNLSVVLQLILGGLLFGTPTIFTLSYNAMHFGYSVAYLSSQVSTLKLILLTAPHAIFEIPAIITAGAAGFKIPYEIIRYLAGKKETILTNEDVKEYPALALISIISIVIAAWIEANS